MPTPLLHQALTQRNLREAWRRVEANGGAPGVDGITVETFSRDLALHFRAYPASVLAGRYAPSALRECLIPKLDDHGATVGTRRLAIPTVADRWLQTALALVLTPILESHFEDVSFAYRRGRSVQQAVARIAQLRDAGYRWVVDADIEQFFDTIAHGPLINQLLRVLHGDAAVSAGITDQLSLAEWRLFMLMREWLRAPLLTVAGVLQTRGVGAPQGSPLSPLLANLYLDTLDDAMIDADHRIVRFADDFLVLCKTRSDAEAALDLTRDVLDTLQLRLNTEKTRIVDFNTGFRFLGVTFVRTLAVPRTPLRSPVDARSRGRLASAQPASIEDRGAIALPAPSAQNDAVDLERAARRPAWSDPGPETALQAELRESGALHTAWPSDAAPPGDAITPSPNPTGQELAVNNDEQEQPQDAASSVHAAKISPRTQSVMSAAFAPEPNGESPQTEGASIEGVQQTRDAPTRNSPTETTDGAPATLRPLPVLRTLYLMEQGATVRLEADRWVVSHEGEVLLDLGLAHIEMVLVFGNVGLSTPALQAAMRQGIPVSFLSRTGSHYGSLQPGDRQHARVLRDQVLAASFDVKRVEFARAFVRAKLANSRTLVQRLGRRRDEHTELITATAQTLREATWRTKTAADDGTLRGIEGAAAAAYWKALRAILPTGWDFPARIERHAPDPVNAMLSFGYSLLRANIVAMLNAHGLNPQVGLYHRDSDGHAALASDLMEEFRALIVDALVWSFISRREVHADDFSLVAGRARLSAAATRRFIHAFEERMQAPIGVRTQSSVDGVVSNRDPISPRHLMLRQIRDLARALRDDSDPYTPFIGR